jgi:hypothetical protein
LNNSACGVLSTGRIDDVTQSRVVQALFIRCLLFLKLMTLVQVQLICDQMITNKRRSTLRQYLSVAGREQLNFETSAHPVSRTNLNSATPQPHKKKKKKKTGILQTR